MNIDKTIKIFNSLDDEAKIDFMIEFSQGLKSYPKNKIQKKYLVDGCVSEVYIYIKLENDRLKFYTKTNSIFVKGYISFLFLIINDMSINEFRKKAKNKVLSFVKKTKIENSLSPTRANTIGNIFKKIESLVEEIFKSQI